MPLSTAALLSAATRTLPRRCMTSAIICMTGDAIAQHSFEHKPLVKHDFVRSAHLGIYGGISKLHFVLIGSKVPKPSD